MISKKLCIVLILLLSHILVFSIEFESIDLTITDYPVSHILSSVARIECLDMNNDNMKEIVVIDSSVSCEDYITFKTKFEFLLFSETDSGYFDSQSIYTFTTEDTINDSLLTCIDDMNSDSYPDIVFGTKHTDTIKLLHNNGDGSFSVSNLLNNITDVKVLKSHDLNNDNYNDLLIGYSNGKIDYFENNGSGFIRHTILDQDDEIKDIDFADFDGNGLTDIAFVKYNYSGGFRGVTSLNIMSNAGNLNFVTSEIFSDWTLGHIAKICDYDSDNDLDILFNYDCLGAASKLLTNDGQENFTASDIDRVIDAICTPDNAFLTFDYSTHNLSLTTQNSVCVVSNIQDPYSDIYQTIISDYDNDSDFDVIFFIRSYYDNNSSLILHNNNGDDTFETKYISWFKEVENVFAVEDMDDNYSQEIICTINSGKYLSCIEKVNGEFLYNNLADFENSISDCQILNIDDDNDKDIVLSIKNDSKIKILTNEGNLTFQEQISIDCTNPIDKLRLADMDLDSDIDIVGWSEQNNCFVLFTNNGDDTFTESIIINISTNQLNFELCDIYNNEFKDILIFSNRNREFEIYQNDGSANFTSTLISYFDGQYSESNLYPLIVDINSDGYWDILQSDKLYENSGDLNFNEISFASNVSRPLAFFDANGDILSDVVYYSDYDQVIKIMQQGTDDFSMINTTSSIESYSKFFAVDYDADNDLDLLYYPDGKLKLLKNNTYISHSNSNNIESPDFNCSIYPNPFNPETTICFTLQKNSETNIDIYNIRGQKVKSFGEQSYVKGDHKVKWSGEDNNNYPVSSGVYFLKIQTSDSIVTKKMILLK